jgi:hypothetical protein
MGVQFFHVNAYSMGGKNPVAGCLREAFRLGDHYTTHIENPVKPVPIFGSLEAVNSALDKYTSVTKDKRGHTLRKDAMSLLAGVYSLPPGTTEEGIPKRASTRHSGPPQALRGKFKGYRPSL